MGRDERLERNAQALEQALAETRRHLREVDGHDERARRASAIEQVAQYVALLREAGAGRSHPPVPFWFKREFPDGRWDVAERVLDAPPRLGDLVAFEDGSCWQVRDSQLVRPRPERKPVREFFVCALAA